MDYDYSRLPTELTKLKQWVCWGWEEMPLKKPMNPNTGYGAKAGKPETWGTFGEACIAPCKGVGFEFVDNGGIVGIDFDNCVKDGKVSSWVEEYIQLFNSYTEYSPSGTGIHILCNGKLPGAAIKTEKAEMYDHGRYFTMTGNVYSEYDQLRDAPSSIDALYKEIAKPLPPSPQGQNFTSAPVPGSYLDIGLKKDDRFKALWGGARTSSDESSNDQALMNKLAYWCNKEQDAMISAFLDSPYCQQKDEKHWKKSVERKDYLVRTAQTAIRDCSETAAEKDAVYQQNRQAKAFEVFAGLTEYKGSVRPNEFTDTDNARIFAEVYRGRAIYATSLGWLVWDGKTWLNDDLKAIALSMSLTDKMLAEADQECVSAYTKLAEVAASEDSEDKKKAAKQVRNAEAYRKHARNSRSRSKIDAIQNLSRALVGIKPDKLDANPYELNTPAGIVNLETGQITPHDPKKLCTKITSCSPGQKGKAIWEEFLKVVSCNDPKMENFLQQIAGMAAVGRVYEECVCMALGSGANGKSSFFNALAAVLNGYACRIDPGILIATNQGKNYDLAVLKGVRLAVAAETDESARLSSAGIKQLASTDKIYAERKYKDPEEFTPSHSLILYTNYAPRVGSTDNGTWRRIVLIPFDAKINPSEDIKNYADYLVSEAGESVLSWIIEGAKNFIAAGHKLIKPEFIEMALEEYQNQNDWMGEFLEEFCDMGQGNTAKAGTLYTTYHEWAKSAHGFARRTDAFGAELEKRGFMKRRTKAGALWHGLSLRPQEYSFSSQNYG